MATSVPLPKWFYAKAIGKRLGAIMFLIDPTWPMRLFGKLLCIAFGKSVSPLSCSFTSKDAKFAQTYFSPLKICVYVAFGY
jgi:hypothetical protein